MGFGARYLHVMGGSGCTDALPTVEIYDTQINTWVAGASLLMVFAMVFSMEDLCGRGRHGQ